MYVEKFSPKIFIYLLIILYLVSHTHGLNKRQIYKSKLPSNKLIRHRRHKMLQIEEMSDEMLLLLDTSCISHGFLKAPDIDNGKVVRYSQKNVPYKSPTIDSGTEKKFLIATYSCSSGYNFEIGEPTKMYCSDKKWIGKVPICIKSGSDTKLTHENTPVNNALHAQNTIGGKCPSEYSKKCDHDCILQRGQPKCVCHDGFAMVEEKCLDVNECKEIENIKDICKYGCINTHGSYYCIKESIYKGKSPVNLEQRIVIPYNDNEDENGSGSGDYPENDYKNEDDEDYNQHKVKIEQHTQVTNSEIEKAQDNSFEFENVKESHPLLDTVTKSTSYSIEHNSATQTDEKVYATTEISLNKEPTVSSVVKSETKIGSKEESDYYYEEYDYKENDKKLENSVTKTDFKEVDGNKLTTQMGQTEDEAKTFVTTIKPLKAPFEQETSTLSIKVIADNDKDFGSPLTEAPHIETNRHHPIETTIQTATKFEETITGTENRELQQDNITTSTPSSTLQLITKPSTKIEEEKLHENKPNNQRGFFEDEYEANYDYYSEIDYKDHLKNITISSTKIAPTEVYHSPTEQYNEIKTTSSEPPFERVTYPSIENRPEVVTIYEEENFVEERTFPQVVDDYDYELLTTTLRTPNLDFETTLFKEVVETTPSIGSNLENVTKVVSVHEEHFKHKPSEEHFLLTTPSSTVSKENHHDSDEGHGKYDENEYKEEDHVKIEITKAPTIAVATSPPSFHHNHTEIDKNPVHKEDDYDEEENENKNLPNTTGNSHIYGQTPTYPKEETDKYDEDSGKDYREEEYDDYEENLTTTKGPAVFTTLQTPINNNQTSTRVDVKIDNEDYKEDDYKDYKEEEYDEKITPTPNISSLVPNTNSSTVKTSITKENDYKEEEYEEEEYDDYKETKEHDKTKDQHFDKENSNNKHDSSHNETRSRALECSLGFTQDNNGNCNDVDECFEKTANCSHDCENTVGSYRCSCPLGYTPSVQNPQMCVDFDECLKQPCSHLCINEIGSFRCECPPNHYFFNETACLKINCSHDHIVTNFGIQCLCPLGFYLNDDDLTCEDLNECEDKQINNCLQNCENTYGSYKCLCREGFELMDDGVTCKNSNHCETNACDHICNNNFDSYTCSCFDGYYLLENGLSCADINECEGSNNCSQVCFNNDGGFDCDCFDGFKLTTDNVQCEDIDECLSQNGDCSHSCVNSRGSYYCECPKHFLLADDKKTCLMHNPCSVENGGCSDMCQNDNGKAVCSCPEYYQLINKTCYLINHCEVDNGGCSHTCEITEGKVDCSCPITHTLTDGKNCVEINLCANNNGGCSHECTMFEGQALCNCPDGHDLKDKMCIRTNLCEINNGNCSHECNFIDDSVHCSCPVNFKLVNETHCIKLKSCLFNNGGCSHQCVDEDDEIVCKCPTNYKLIDEKNCVESDPCSINNGGCSHECLYNDKKVTCLCPSGYNLIGKSCHPTDPCHFRNGGCSHKCENINGEAFCRCPSGFMLIDRHCFELNPCSINNGGCSHYCTNQNGLVKCSCPNGYILEDNKCFKQNPCSLNNGGCSHLCNFTRGVQTCSCPSGYILRPNKKLCKEINECKSKNGGCSHGCRNLPGSYECTCPNGFLLDQNNKTCLDVNECSENNGDCQQICRNYPGGFRCQCREGHLLQNDRRTCKAKSIANCYVPQAPKNGRIRCLQMDMNNSSHVPVGTQCIVWCNYGYKVRGRTMTTCNSLGNWDIQMPYCEPISCPKLGNVANGYFTPNSCSNGNLYPGEMCTLNCHPGHKPSQDFKTLTCLTNLQWSSSVSESSLSNACTQDSPVPFIRCPHGGFLSFTLPKGRSTMLVTIPKPQTNVEWWQYVSSKPSWGMRLQNYLSSGRTDIIYSARSHSTNLTVSCRLIVNIVDKEIPEVVNCPNNIEYKLGVHEYSRAVSWTEPTFRDNIGVVNVYKSREPGTRYRLGTHYVNYVARDEAGNQAKCHFTITIKGNDVKENQSRVYRSILICPHGIQYMNKRPEEYDNEALKKQGCYWNQMRTSVPINQRSYMARSYKNDQEDEPSENSIKQYHPFSLYNKCC